MIKHATVLAMTLAVVAGCTSGSADGVQIPGAVPETTIALDASEPDTSTTEPPPETVATTAAPVVEPVVTEPPVTDVATTVPPPVTEAPAPTDPPPAPDEFLRLGDENPEVSIMQLKLVALGYLSAGYTDGLFDRATADGLIEFQGQYGLIVDGVFGPQTDRSLTAAAQSVNVDG